MLWELQRQVCWPAASAPLTIVIIYPTGLAMTMTNLIQLTGITTPNVTTEMIRACIANSG